MTSLYIFEVIMDFFRAIMTVYFFNRIMPPRNKKYSKVYGMIMVIVYTLISSNRVNHIVYRMKDYQVFIFIFICYNLVFIYPLLFRRGRMSEKVFLSSFYISAILASSFIVYIILAKVFNVTLVELFLDVSYKRIIGLIISRFIQFMIVCIFLNNINFIKYAKYKTLYVVGFILFLNHIIIFVIERYLIKNLHKINMYIIVIAISIGIIQILLVYILNIFSKEMEENFILKMNLNRKIYDEEIIDMYKKMTGWKHDFRNHINMILGLVEANSKDDVISYINEIDIGIRELDKNIYTDNIAINSILVSKIKVAKYKNIKVNLDIKINSEIKISNVDICIILGNLLDNSIEACSMIEGYKFIDLRIISENNRLVIKISNSTNGYVNEINGKFLTTKNNKINGIGLIQIDSIVKKHNGYINRKHENNIFRTYAMIQYED